MKLLLDTCVWGGAAAELERAGHEVVWAGSWSSDPGDEKILAMAHKESRVLITLDKDFGELAIVRGQAHSGIIRLVGLSAMQQAAHCEETLKRFCDELQHGAIVTVEPGRWRVRPGTGS